MSDITGERIYYVVLTLVNADQSCKMIASIEYSTTLRLDTHASIVEAREMALEQAQGKYPELDFDKAFIVYSMELH